MSLLSQWSLGSDNLEQMVPIQPGMVQTLDWWSHREGTCLGVPLEDCLPSAARITDASEVGWGAHVVMGEKRLQKDGEWPSSYSGRSINSLELETILLALEHFGSILGRRTILVRLDNTTVVAYVRKH